LIAPARAFLSFVAMSKQSDFKFRLRAIARTTYVTVLLVDDFTVCPHHI